MVKDMELMTIAIINGSITCKCSIQLTFEVDSKINFPPFFIETVGVLALGEKDTEKQIAR